MKAPFPLAMVLALSLLLTSCVTDSVNPLSSPDTAQADQQLVGDWREKSDPDKNIFRFSTTHDGWMHVEIIPGKPGDKADSYDFFTTVIGGDHFLNVRMTGKDDSGHPTKSYVFLHYAVVKGRVLHLWMMSQDAAAAAVRGGKLKGLVQEDKHAIMVGKPPHPDVDVTLLDSSANIAKFIQTAGVNALFSEKMKTMYRIKTAGH